MTGFSLKLLATASMLLDHMGVALFPAAMWLRCAGRIAFPLFCFLIAEGCAHTHSRKRYALRLLAFAVLSEIPFNLIHGAVWDHVHQNVLWTLLAGAAACWLMDDALNRRGTGILILTGAAMVAIFWLLEALHTDYGGWGMLLVVLFYGAYRAPFGRAAKMAVQAAGLAVFCLASMGGASMELWGLLALLPVWCYNGRRGFSGKVVQYGFYAFYPAHLLILSLLAMYV